jgi:hypothetical protein
MLASGCACGLFVALEEIMVEVGVYRDGYTGLDIHRMFVKAVNRVLAPARLRLLEMECFEHLETTRTSGGALGGFFAPVLPHSPPVFLERPVGGPEPSCRMRSARYNFSLLVGSGLPDFPARAHRGR